MTAARIMLVWMALAGLCAAEIVAATSPALRWLPPFIGIAMALLIAFTFMRLGASRGLTPVFALAGVFWLCVLLGMGSLDAFTRHDIAAPRLTYAR